MKTSFRILTTSILSFTIAAQLTAQEAQIEDPNLESVETVDRRPEGKPVRKQTRNDEFYEALKKWRDEFDEKPMLGQPQFRLVQITKTSYEYHRKIIIEMLADKFKSDDRDQDERDRDQKAAEDWFNEHIPFPESVNVVWSILQDRSLTNVQKLAAIEMFGREAPDQMNEAGYGYVIPLFELLEKLMDEQDEFDEKPAKPKNVFNDLFDFALGAEGSLMNTLETPEGLKKTGIYEPRPEDGEVVITGKDDISNLRKKD